MSLPQNLDRFETLVSIVARLRAPDGCPWDRKQTHTSLREHLLEESYEVLEALDGGDPEQLCEELGDLLLQIVLHAQISAEAGDFELGDIVRRINAKLIHRHPHVFGSSEAASVDEVLVNWEMLKKMERDSDVSMLDGIPRRMPALSYAQSVQRRVARVGFDWESDDGVIDKLAEEVGEFRQAASQGEKAAEFGDLVFTLANIARRLGIDLESALRETNERFYRRFACMEKLCHQRGLNLIKLSLAEKDALWEEVKKGIAGSGDGRDERT
ncbi:MAG: nucleoside triphosphate pyrophosphohydrolase [Dehalococcoidales bacterium]|nr:nucleoside triphosphate pyrophosphohydrolase [Dehalococcoidales bacterium]